VVCVPLGTDGVIGAIGYGFGQKVSGTFRLASAMSMTC
jgi:hypothetical protein